MSVAPVCSPITPLAPPCPATRNFFSQIPLRSRMFRPGQASRRHKHFGFCLVPFCGVDPWVTDSITPLATTPAWAMQPDNLYRRPSPGNRRARRGIPARSSSISGGLDIPSSPIGFILACRCVPATWSVPSGRSYIKWRFPTLPGFHSLPLIRKQILCHHSLPV